MRLGWLWGLGLIAGLFCGGAAQAQVDNTFTRADAYRAERAAACRAGDLDACAQEGQNYSAGLRVAQNLPLAVEFLGRACDGGRLAACVNLGTLYAEPGRSQHRPDTAMALFERACAGGETGGCEAGSAALRNADGRTYRDWTRAESFLRRACDRDLTESCWRLGVVYLNGDSVPQDFGRAAGPLEKACLGGRRQACEPAARIVGSGRGVPEDGAKAERLINHGCELGDSNACQVRDQLRAFMAGQ